MQMPFFPQGVTHINPMLAFSKEGGKIAYVTGNLQIYSHEEDDSVAFKMITAQFCANGMAKQAEVVRAFGVPSLAVKRAVKLFRQEGTRGFYKPRKRRAAAVLTAQVCAQVQALLDAGSTISEVAEQNNIKRDTLSKAVRAGRLRPPRVIEADRVLSKSGRSEQDSAAPMGMGASNVQARVAASLGQLVAVAPSFEPALDVPCGGVLFALPALLAVGLLDKAEACLKLPDGYYGLDSLLLLCAFMALVRLESLECLRYRAPGEWGKLLGLDPILFT
jgi:transposase-like protein